MHYGPKTATALIGGAVLTIALSGCGAGSSSSPEAGGTQASGSAHPSKSPSGGKTPKDGSSASGSSYHQPKGAIADLSGVTCAADDAGSWSMKGTLTNKGQQDKTYEVLVAVIKPQTSEVLGDKQLTVKVAAGKTAPVSAPGFYHGKTDGVRCTQVVTLRG